MHLSTSLVAFGAALASALPQVEIKGNQYYFSSNGSEFKIRGLAYQPGGQQDFLGNGNEKHDPLSRPDICKRDAPIIQKLGANVVRVYNLHSDLNHDECVTVFNNAGIYLMLDVNSPAINSHISEKDPKSTYHRGYLESIFSVIDAFKGYDNVIGFFSGNEIINEEDQVEENPLYIRAVIRDMKRYLSKHSDRFIGVGYAGTDTRSSTGAGADSVTDLWKYLSCDDDNDVLSRSDFFAVNIYSWCADATWRESGYPELVEDFKETSLPVFWSEHGCNQSPRLFNEVPAMYGRDEMIDIFAGGIVFEYSNEPNNFGLIEIDEDDQSVTLREDYHALSKQYDSVNWDKIKNIKEDDIKVVDPPNCSNIEIKGSKFAKEFDIIPATPEDAGDLMENGSGNKNVGKLLDSVSYDHKYKIYDGDDEVTSSFSLNVAPDADVSDAGPNKFAGAPGPKNTGGGGGDGEGNGDGNGDGDDESAAGHVAAGIFAVAAPLVAGLFVF